MSNTVKKKYIHVAIILAFMLLFRFLPPFGPLTPLGMEILGIFIGMIYGWTIGEMGWPSVIGLLLLGLIEGNTVDGVLATAFGNTTLIQVLFAMLFCYGIERCGLLSLVAKWILSREFTKKGPYWILFSFWLAAILAGMVVGSGLPVSILLWNIFYSVAEKMDWEPKTEFVTIALIGICIFAYSGATSIPYFGTGLAFLGVFFASAPEMFASMNRVSYLILMVVFNIIALPTAIAVVKYVLRPKVTFKEIDRIVDASELHMTKIQKIVTFYIILLILMMVLPNVMPKTFFLTGFLGKMGANGVFMFVLVLMNLTYLANGESLLELAEGMVRGMPWGLYFLLLGALTIANYLTSPTTGISTLLLNLVSPILSTGSAALFIIAITVLVIAVTNCINNVVTLCLFAPICLGLLATNGINPYLIGSLVAFSAIQGIVMPAGSVLGAMLHGNTEWLVPKMIYKYAIVLELVFALVLAFVGLTVGNLLF